MPFDTLLVANRGEVALRVVRTARRLGLRTVAVYSDADRDAPHVGEADRAVRIGPAPAAESYLRGEAIVAAALQTGAGAVHPGYGFLSESATFARECEHAGLQFVGPQPDVIELMSRKDSARCAAVAAGAPVLPAVEQLTQDIADQPAAVVDLARRVAREVGFPALVKAVAGGGGKGMRVVTGPVELGDALAAAAREARAAFGDGTLFVERYMPAGRHLEVQVAGDGSGRALHLYDRDCSVQRRHQKVLEEAPASVNSPEARRRALDAAVRLAAHVSYRSLGTVEFLACGEDVFFLEMNTRLQVEHPVTEAVTGLDLVEIQLRLARGEPLGLAQDDVKVTGHAIEVRVYAEDTAHGFLPQAGRAARVCWPTGVRVDAALRPGQEVGTHYDPMLGKLVSHATDREGARRKLLDALDVTAIFGLPTNLGMLRRLVASQPFARGEVGTGWLEAHAQELLPTDEGTALAAAALWLAEEASASTNGPWRADGWRSGGPPAPTWVTLLADGQRNQLAVHRHGSTARIEAGTRSLLEARTVRRGDEEGHPLLVELDGVLERFDVLAGTQSVMVSYRGAVYRFERAGQQRRAGAAGEAAVVAPLPGILVEVYVAEGDMVAPGQLLGVLESMKMEYPLRAGGPAKVEHVAFAAGSAVRRGDLLFDLAAEGDARGGE
ncbi:MAG TPA: biotin carboxylase N-terminal domain-containing protein [Acidimicrobiales bacterium]|nr:biotin carboxylase N-terminal domain-containing protein [Acidimicrobiales bacterium]